MSDSRNQADHLIKCVLLGKAHVGKSSILLRFVANNFTATYETTIGVDFVRKIVQSNNKSVTLQLWDTAGDEQFKPFIASYLRGAGLCIVVFDVNDPASFNTISDELAQIRAYAGENIATIIVGNKIDHPNRAAVTFKEAKAFADSKGIPYIEVSAKSGEGVNQVFETGLAEYNRLTRPINVNPSSETGLAENNRRTIPPASDIKLEEFRVRFMYVYNSSRLFKRSKMLPLLQRNDTTMEHVIHQAEQDPNSRGARILKRLEGERKITLDDFVTAYNEQFKSERIYNPFSKMAELLRDKKIHDIQEVIEYARKHPGSRTDKVIDKIIAARKEQENKILKTLLRK